VWWYVTSKKKIEIISLIKSMENWPYPQKQLVNRFNSKSADDGEQFMNSIQSSR